MSLVIVIGAIILLLVSFILLIGIYQKNTNAVCISKKRLDGKTALVTGGTAGMGLEIAKDFAQRGARVIVACPYENEGIDAVKTIKECSDNQNVVFKFLNLASFASTRDFALDIIKTEDRLDILINNAGVGGPNKKTGDGLNLVLQVNFYSAFLLTILLLPLLKKTGKPGEPSRIVNTSSIFHLIGNMNLECENYFLTVQPYANSKLYVVLFSRELMRRLKGCNVVINNADPGAVGTAIFRTVNYFGFIVTFLFWVLFKTPWQGAQTAIHVALDKKAGEVSGEFFKNCKQTRAVRRAYNDKLAAMVWNESVRLVKLEENELEKCLQR